MKHKIKTNKYKILLILFVISLISSILLSLNVLTHSPVICDVTEGCYIVANSEYSKSFGVENAYWGLGFFIILTGILLCHMKNPKNKTRILINIGVLISGLWAIYSFYLMEFVIEAYCKYCTALDVSSLIAVAIVLYAWND